MQKYLVKKVINVRFVSFVVTLGKDMWGKQMLVESIIYKYMYSLAKVPYLER